MTTLEAQKIYNGFRTSSINARQFISIKDAKSGQMFKDFMLENYEFGHWDLIKFMQSKNTMNLLKSHLAVDEKGYIKVYVRKSGDSFETYGIEFIPYRINRKDWGLGYMDENPNDFFFFECLYENDLTKFRGCYKK